MSKAMFALSALLILLTGCSNPFGSDGSQVDPGHSPGLLDAYKLPNGKGSESVAMSKQFSISRNRHYKLSGSLSNHSTEIRSKTSRGYTLYSNVQGQLISEDAIQ